MELRIENNRGFWSQKTIVCNEEITLVQKIDFKYDVYLCFKNGEKIAKIKVKDKFVLPKEIFTDGVIETNVEIYYKETIVKRIPCDRLIVQDSDKELKVIPEIEILKSVIEEQNRKIDKLSDKLDFFIKLWKEEL